MLLHASAVVYAKIGCLLLGAPGAGKSTLIAGLIHAGGSLIADDQVQLRAEQGKLMASALAPLEGVLELRSLGLVRISETIQTYAMDLVIELTTEDSALETMEIEGVTVKRVSISPRSPVAPLMLYLDAMRDGRILPADWAVHESSHSKPCETLA
jgi:HPr kinase/phosphorylase